MAQSAGLTAHRADNDPAGPAKEPEERVIAFFGGRTGA
jgi:hypothetical protein